jgi:hypothetical protein
MSQRIFAKSAKNRPPIEPENVRQMNHKFAKENIVKKCASSSISFLQFYFNEILRSVLNSGLKHNEMCGQKLC